ncbi:MULTISPECIES: sugar 3,4-ketoisomerase [Aeromonas]|jgi:dTDP-4-dehydrorhamnose 3,5-epimerase-like enzyme|uniref:sugar 3,4-ketoisomerase n=1 Tax=Aeromonas TaxID=642 RepID=UPI0005B1FD34|nr:MULTISPECIES: FdtA/QdtA family cupin domain-containing protein [Aeromonas]MBS4641725.1 WxcM-like domain-containing protein [Aeromonas media]MDW4561117.1 FdtA/QdtA family cupin domain-containing protein [Aeromonas rivipollensis]RQX24775.1 WxcM-like domain-containing protein [Aeromonas caviae]
MKINFIQFQTHGDDRGSLISLEQEKNIPFEIQRIYYIFNTKEGVRRGFHAHKKLKQIAIVISGSCRFVLDDGKERIDILMDNPGQGLYIDSFIWREMYNFSEDCVLLVIADKRYEEVDYIRSYEEFLQLVGGYYASS